MDYTKTEAWAAGEAEALRQIALQPPDDHTISVSLDPPGHDPDREYFKLCLLCSHKRGSKGCGHDASGEQLRNTRLEDRSELATDPQSVEAP